MPKRLLVEPSSHPQVLRRAEWAAIAFRPIPCVGRKEALRYALLQRGKPLLSQF